MKKLPKNLIPLSITAILIIASITLFTFFNNNLEIQNKEKLLAKYATESQNITLVTEDLIHGYSDILIVVRGLFSASTLVERDEWKIYVESLDIESNFPALSALSFVERVDKSEKEEYINLVRSDNSIDEGGYPDFNIKPESSNDEHYVVHYIEPLKTNEAAFGFDLFSNPARREAIEHARDTNSVVFTEPIVLIQENGEQKAFLIILPVYKQEANIDTLEDRRQNIVGLISAVVRVKDIFSQVVLSSPLTSIRDISVNDVTNESQELLLSISENGLQTVELDLPTVQTLQISAGTRTWELEFKSDQTYDTSSLENITPLIILVSGIVISILVGLILHNATRLQLESESLAKKLTKDLAKFKLAVEGASDHIVITDLNGIILYANPATSVLTGYSNDEILGQRSSLWGKQMGKEYYKKMWATLKVKKQQYKGQLKNKRKNGEIYFAEVKISPILDDKGEIAYFIGIERDISKEKEVDRLKTEFLSVASHQLRTPLGSMRWNMEMLLGGDAGELNFEVKQIVEQIYESDKRMITLVNDLLNVSRIDQGRVADEPKFTDIVVIIQEAVIEIEPLAKEQSVIVKLEVKKDHIPQIMFDPKRFREVVQNLLSNAVKYNKPQGTVNVEVQKLDAYVEVKITDTGMGIPKKDQNRLFSKFFRAENAVLAQTEGSGLGLFVVKSYVEAWGGKVSFESEEGKGTTFIITLPIKTKSGNLSKNLADQPHQIKNA